MNRGIDPRWQGLMGNQPLYGLLGRIASQYTGSGNGDSTNPANLPDWLRSQYENVPVSEGGSDYLRMGTGMRDQQGRGVFQIGENDSDENVIDPNNVWYDQQLGLLTDPRNVAQKDHNKGLTTAVKLMIAAGGAYVAGAGMGAFPTGAEGGALAGAEGAGALEAGAGGAFDMGGSAGVFDSMGYPLYPGGMEAGAGAGSATGAGGAAGGGGAGGGQGLLGQGQDLLGQAGTWVQNNPLRAASLLNTGYGMLNQGGGGQSSGSSPGGGGGKSGGGAGVGGPAMKTERPQWNPNPYLQAQLQRGGYL